MPRADRRSRTVTAACGFALLAASFATFVVAGAPAPDATASRRAAATRTESADGSQRWTAAPVRTRRARVRAAEGAEPTAAEERATGDAATRSPDQVAEALLDATDRALCGMLVDHLGRGGDGVRTIEAAAAASDALRRRLRDLDPRPATPAPLAFREGLAAARVSDDASVRLFALRATVACCDDLADDAARAALADPSADVRTAAARALGRRTTLGAASVGPLSTATCDSDARVRRAALDALVPLADDDATQVILVRALRDGDAAVRQAAARVLGRATHADPAALRALSEARSDGDPGVASAASRAYLDLGTR